MVYEGIIEGLTVRLRSVEESDAEVTFQMRSDPTKNQYIHGATGTVEDQRNFILRQREKPGDYLFLVEDKEGKAIGMKGLYDYDPEKNDLESGRFMGFGSQVQNIEALMLSLDFAFDILQVSSVRMSALETNTGMLGIQKKFGVEETGAVFNEDFGCRSIYSLLTKEMYQATRPNIQKLLQRFAGR